MVTGNKKDSLKTPAKQGSEERAPEPNKISASTPYDFSGKNQILLGHNSRRTSSGETRRRCGDGDRLLKVISMNRRRTSLALCATAGLVHTTAVSGAAWSVGLEGIHNWSSGSPLASMSA